MTKLWDKKASEVSPEEFALIEAEERLVYETQKAIRALMKKRKVSAAKLAERLGVSQARVSQMLGGSATNLTLRTVARVYRVLESHAMVCEQTVRDEQSGRVRSKAEPAGDALAPVEETYGRLEAWAEMFRSDANVGALPALAAAGTDAVWVLDSMIAPARDVGSGRPRSSGETRRWLDDVPPPHVIQQAYAHA